MRYMETSTISKNKGNFCSMYELLSDTVIKNLLTILPDRYL